MVSNVGVGSTVKGVGKQVQNVSGGNPVAGNGARLSDIVHE